MSKTHTLVAALNLVLSMASAHVESIETGIEDGTCFASENQDLQQKKDALEIIRSYSAFVTDPSDETILRHSLIMEMWLTFADDVLTDQPIDGGDAVDWIVGWIHELQKK